MPIALANTITVGSGGSFALNFTNISQTGKDLLILVSGRGGDSNFGLSFNNDTGNNYVQIGLEANYSGAPYANPYTTNGIFAFNNRPDSTANTFGSTSFYVSNYTSSINKFVSVDSVTENNATSALAMLKTARWTGSAAITSLTLSGEMVQGTTVSLYIVDAASASATGSISTPRATGGTITLSGGFWYHTFTTSGTFAPTQSISCDVLCVAGGGGSGWSQDVIGAAGGGAGGYQSLTNQSLTAQNYTVTVGAGGGGGNSGTPIGSTGSNSQFGSLVTSTGGGGGQSTTGGVGGNGGSGGGGVWTTNGGAGGAGIAGQGNAGGAGTNNNSAPAGGGGGAGAAGASATSGGAGGVGLQWLNGSFYAGGGSGARSSGAAAGGNGGGGAAGQSGNVAGSNGTTNTGGGAGGRWWSGSATNGNSGGSGIVIVRYAA